MTTGSLRRKNFTDCDNNVVPKSHPRYSKIMVILFVSS